MKNKILRPTQDFIFKLIFGDSRNVDILADFLQAVLDLPESEYSHITIVDPHLKPEVIGGKLGILDVKLHTKSGKILNVEVQVSDFPQMRDRIVFYTSKMITEQIGKGEAYDLKKVISIVITDYRMITENEEYHNIYHLYDKNTDSKFTDVVEINILELPKLPKETDKTDLWNWLKFLQVKDEEDFDMIAKTNPNIKKAVGVLMDLSQDERTRLIAEEREKAMRDERARMEGAFKQGRAQGVELGIKKGVEKGIYMTAKNLLSNKLPIDIIIKCTGLSTDDIEKLKKEIE